MRNADDRILQSYFTLSISGLAQNIILIEKKDYLQIHLQVMTPVCTNQSIMKCWLLKNITPHKNESVGLHAYVNAGMDPTSRNRLK